MKMHERIRLYIEGNGMKFNFVAKNAGINPKRFYRLMDGKAPLTVEDYETICRNGLGLEPGYFFTQKFLKTKNELCATSETA